MNTDIEILLDKTAEYLLKYDASEEGKKCAYEIQDYYEYRPNYILGCLDYARRFAHKAQTIDIDEDPNEFMSVANKAYYAWASSMETQNENTKKNKIKITESKLKQIVAESVKKVLKENISENYWDEINRLLTNLYGWTQFYEEEFDKANIKDNGGRYSMRGALSEMQNIIGRLSDLCNDGRKMYN